MPYVDGNLQTSRPGIYAAGDVSGIEEASSAMVEGRLAGFAAAQSLGYGGSEVEGYKQSAREELNELRAGPMGGRIRAGVDKAEKQKVPQYVNINRSTV